MISATKDLADRILNDFEKLDILINNAGVYSDDFVVTEDGFELTMQTNVIAPYILLCKLFPLLQRTPTSRVINVSSISQGGRS